jgi:hypothetical protein
MSAPQDRNQAAVVVSQVLGVFLVMITLVTQHGELHSWRPTGTKNQEAAKDDAYRNKFARLWEDPLEDLPTFQVAATSLSPSPTPSAKATPVQTGAASMSPTLTIAVASAGAGFIPDAISAAGMAAALQLQVLTAAQAPNQGSPASLPQGHSVSKYIFLWNIVDARPLPETTERRIRTRYALVSAILAEGYLPLRESVLRPLFQQGFDATLAKERPIVGRFESFRKRAPKGGKTWRYVSVIWTPKQSLESPFTDQNEQDRVKAAIWQEDEINPPRLE